MKFGWDKCKTLNLENGKINLVGYETVLSRPVDELKTNKYLGFLQPKRIEHTGIKKELTVRPSA